MFQTKMRTVEARQFTGGKGHKAILDWVNSHDCSREAYAVYEGSKICMLRVPAVLGRSTVHIGYWIVRDADGDFSIWSNGDFTERFEPMKPA